MTTPALQRVRKQPPSVFPTEKDFEKFKPLLEVFLHQWFVFLASVKSATDAGQTIISGGSGGVYAAGRATFVNTSNTLFVPVPGILATSIVIAMIANNGGGSAPSIWHQSTFATSGFTLYQTTTSSLDVNWIVVNP